MTGQDDTGLDFWSRRKAAVRKAEADEQAEKEAGLAAEERGQLEQKSDKEILEELGLPDPDTLSENDDFSGFLKATVPERLRRRALRKLWGLNPVLANLDGLVDYGDDFTDSATVVENLQTVYRIGKGMLEQFAEEDEDEDPVAGEAHVTAVEAEDIGETENEDFEENTALHNDYCENGTTSVQLTQSVDVVQSGEIRVEPSVDLENDAVLLEEEPRQVRRRLRFDYS